MKKLDIISAINRIEYGSTIGLNLLGFRHLAVSEENRNVFQKKLCSAFNNVEEKLIELSLSENTMADNSEINYIASVANRQLTIPEPTISTNIVT